jgi:putative chitinase
MWFFEKNKIWDLCDKGTDDATITAVTKKVNGGTIGLEDRIKHTHQYAGWL